MRDIEVGRIYRHFKGSTYYIRHIGEHTETGEAMVVYSKIDLESKIGLGALKSKVYVRPLSMFIDKVDKEKYPNSTQEYRFELLER